MGKLLVIASAGKRRQQLVRWLEQLGQAVIVTTQREVRPEMLRGVDLVIGFARRLLSADRSRWPRLPPCPQLWIVEGSLPPEQLREQLAPILSARWSYLAAPFTPAELASAIVSLLCPASLAPSRPAFPAPAGLRPSPPASTLSLRVHDCLVNLEQRCIHRPDGTCIRLSETEAAILRYLLRHRSRVISREELLRQVWGIPAEGLTTRTVDMHIARLRAKLRSAQANALAAPAIVTVRRRGYQVGPAWSEASSSCF